MLVPFHILNRDKKHLKAVKIDVKVGNKDEIFNTFIMI